MTNSQNLEMLIKQHDALKAENERLRRIIEDFRQIANIPPSNLVVSTQHPKIIREMTAAIRETYAKYTEQAPAAEVEAIAPKPFSIHRIDSNGFRPDAVHFGMEALPSILEVLRHIESKQWWILRNSDSVMIAQSKD